MRNLNRAAAAALLCCFAVSASIAMPPGGNKGKGGQGGGESAVRLCVNFATQSEPYINDDGRVQYCDGTDGEILTGEGLKFSTTTRNPNESTVYVKFQGSSCDDERTDDPPFGAKTVDRATVDNGLDAFFGWQKSKFTGTLCPQPDGATMDPFAAGFNPNALECLTDSNTDTDFLAMKVGDPVAYMSWRVNLADPELSFKKGGEALLIAFAGAFGPRDCPLGDGDITTSDGGLPVAIECTDDDGAEENPQCTAWHVRTFRGCAYDYDTAKGGNWRWGGDGCPANSEMAFSLKP